MDNLHKKQSLLFHKLLEENKVLTSMQLSLYVGVSVRTIKTYINEINNKIIPFHICIKSKAREGYWIEFEDGADLESVKEFMEEKIVDKYDEIPKFNYERINYIIKKLLVVDYHIKLEDLMDEIFVSRSTLSQDLKEVRVLLSKFHLKVVTRSNYGIIIEGSEIDKRLCISEYFFHYTSRANYAIETENMFQSGRSKEEYERILNYIKDVCSEYEIMISDFSLNNFAIHASIAMRRCTFYNYVIVNEEKIADLRNTIEFRAADTFVKLLEKEFNCMLPVGETVYYAMHLQSKSIYDEVILNNEDSIKIKKCISILLSEIKSNFELDFDQDQELYDYLYMHIPQMILRLKNHMVIRNPLVYDNLRRYLFATKVTHSACAVIENFYNVEVDINEFGYLVLYFNLAISKFENRRKIRIGIICGRGRPESIMYYNEICENFSASRYEVIKLENTNTNEIIFNSIDFLISTYELPKNKIPTYIIRNDFYIEEIRKAVNDYQYHTIDIGKYFNHDNSYFHMEGTTKEEVLQNLYKLLYTKDLLKSIPDETNGFKSDELGNGIVHFQDIYRLLRKSLCFVVVLQHPILWNQDIVRVLIITKTKKEGDKDLPALCRIVSRWSNRIDKVEHLIATQDYNIFLKDIMEV